MAGYSGTPLAKKLGIKPGTVVHAIGAPRAYRTWLAPLPDETRFTSGVTPAVDIVHLFATTRKDLQRHLTSLRKAIRHDAAVWVSWPKRTSGVATDITEDTIRDVALPMGLVDIKVCAVDETWSGLKLVIRKELR